MKKILIRLALLIGKNNFSIDDSISTIDLFTFFSSKFIEYLRGLYSQLRFKRCSGFFFKGKNCVIKYHRKIQLGKSVFFGENVYINALSKRGIRIGNNFSLHRNSIIDCTGVINNLGEELVIGNNVGFSFNCLIQVRGSINIGNNVIFGPYVSLIAENHLFDDFNIPVNEQGVNRKGIIIEDGVWVGAGVTILDGVIVGKNSVIAAGAVINRDVPPYSVVGGVPGKILKNLKLNK